MAADELSYFHSIEEIFVRLRGAPLLLSPEDWRIARGWEEKGVPLSLVRQTLEELFERRRGRGDDRRIHSLKYCAPAVEQAWREAAGLSATGRREPAPAIDLGARLSSLADSLPAGYEGFADRVRRLEGSPEEVERLLEALDREVVAVAEAGLDAADRHSLDAEARAGAAELLDRLPESEIEGAVADLRRHGLRRRLGLPVLSLFSRQARAG